MSANSEIGWTDHTWPVIRGCSKLSDGCKFCWAIRDAHLHAGNKNPKMQAHFQGLTVIENGRPNWTGVVRLDKSILEWPLRWKTAARIFAASSGDLFHENLPFESIACVFLIMAMCQQHDFQVLTKRADRLLPFYRWFCRWAESESNIIAQCAALQLPLGRAAELFHVLRNLPLPNVWLGVSVEDQPTADARIPLLLQTPAALRFVSYEPALAAVDFRSWLPIDTIGGVEMERWLDWAIVGGESGPGARPCQLEWIESPVDQFAAAGVPLFVKQVGSRPVRCAPGCLQTRYPITNSKGGDWNEWPEKIRVREFPATKVLAEACS